MKKLLFISMVALLLIGTAWAQTGNVYHEVQIVDERGVKVTAISSVHIYAPDSVTDAVIYADRGLQNTITIPMTSASDNTTLSNGKITWYGPDGYNFSITDGTNIATNANHRERTSSEGTIVFPSYITAISSTTYGDTLTATWGTSPAFTQSIAAGVMTFTPGSDNTAFNIGVSGTSLNSDLNVFVGAALGLKLDAGDPSLTWDGGAVLINHNSSFNVGINTGTSTANTSIGSDTGGTIALETTAGITVTADDSYALSVTAGTVGISSAAGDITIDATDKSVIIRGTEEAGDAIYIHADGTAGGIDITSGTGDIVMVSTDDISMTVNTTTTDNIIITNTPGTAANAIDIDATAGGIDVDFATAKDMAVTGGQFIFTSNEDVASAFSVITNTGSSETITIVNTQGTAAGAIAATASAGGITLTADGATAGDITLDSEDDLILTSTGKVTITNTEVVTISGGATITGVTTIASALVTPVEVVAATNEIEITESGTVYVLNHATEFVTTLPTVSTSAGVTFRFIIGAAPADADYTIVTDTLENKIFGMVLEAENDTTEDGPVGQDEDTITFVRAVAVVGDWVELTSDGVGWYVSGMTAADGGVTLTAAD